MNFGDPIPKIPQNQPLSDIEAVSLEARKKAENFLRPQIQKLLEVASEQSDKKRFVVEQIDTFGRKMFKGKENILNEALAKIEVASYTTDKEFEEILVRELASAILTFVESSGFSEQDAKIYFRRFAEERDGNTPLDSNGILSYSRFEEKIDLHITDGFTIPLFQEDMSKLAKIVRGDESIKTIKMTSWVVAKHPNAVKKFGFTLGEPLSEAVLVEIRSQLPPEMRDKPIAEASMTREDFLKKFG